MQQNSNNQNGSQTNQNSQNQKPGTLSWSQPAAAQNKNNTMQPFPKAQVPMTTTPVNAKQDANKLLKSGEQQSNTGKYVLWIFAGLVAGLLIAWGWNATHKTPSDEVIENLSGATLPGATNSTTPASSVTPSITTNGGVAVASPQVSGTQVSVSNVVVSVPTWVVVYEDHGGKPGNALGAALFNAGQTSGTVELLRGTLPGQSYLVGESVDGGTKVFSLTDKPVTDANGNLVLTQFTTN